MNQVFMKRAIELASRGIGGTSPNPCVGAIIVKGGEIVSEGWHNKAGDEHAEIVAIRKIMDKSGIVTVDLDPSLFHNADLYVTLEPCSHHGKTDPCADVVLEAGFRKVCVGMVDPFRRVKGRGIKVLRKNCVNVEVCKAGTGLSDEIRTLNQPFIKWASTGIPYVVMKAGVSLDGKIATSAGKSKWITSEEAREDARLERSLCDAILVGAGTVMADDPELAAHGKFKNKKLLRVIIDSKLKLSLNKKVFRDENVFVACSDLASDKNKAKFKEAGIEFKSFGNDKVSIKRVLKFLGKREIQSLFVEGGSAVNGSFYDAASKDKLLLDKVIFYVAPKIIGGKESLPVVGGKGVEKLSKVLRLEKFETDKIGDDVKLQGVLNVY